MSERIVAEEWRAVPGYEGWYEVSSLGQVRSLPRVISHPKGPTNRSGELRSLVKDQKGYLRVRLCKNGMWTFYKVHRLVMLVFVESATADRQVNHKDGNKANNRLDNLEYATADENMKHAIAAGLKKVVSGQVHGMAKLNWADVEEIRRLRGSVSQVQLAERYGVRQTTISSIQLGLTWKTP